MKIQILGQGCNKCTQLAESTTAAAEEMGINYVIGKMFDLKKTIWKKESAWDS